MPKSYHWFPVIIKALCPEPRSYQIETPEGITYRRTQNHLKLFKSSQKTQTKEQYQKQCQKRALIKKRIKKDTATSIKTNQSTCKT